MYTRYRVALRNVKRHPKFKLVDGVSLWGGGACPTVVPNTLALKLGLLSAASNSVVALHGLEAARNKVATRQKQRSFPHARHVRVAITLFNYGIRGKVRVRFLCGYGGQ